MHTNFKHIVFVFFLINLGSQYGFSQKTTKSKDSIELSNSKLVIKAQDSTKTDTIVPPKEFLDDIIRHKSEDYITNDFINQRTTLYNNAELYYQDIELKAGIIIIDYKNNLAYAKGIVDSLGNYIQKPQFKQAGQESEQDSLIYNFKNEKAVIYNARTEQPGGMILIGEITKRENDSVFYINKARLTTSPKEKPDYFIGTNNIKIVPGKKVVGGLSQLYLADVPTPAVLPFFYAPLSKELAASGFLIPTWGSNNNQGFFLQNGGYYFAINDYVDLAVLGDVYTNGSWGLRFESNYALRYRFSGSFSLRFENLLTSQRGFDDFSQRNNFYLRWSHSQDSKSNPNSRFSTSVNLGSSQYFRESLNEFNIGQTVTNTFSSSISYYKKFVGTPFNMNLSLNHTQNTNTEQIDMTLPSLQVSMDRIYPFAPGSGAKKNALQNIGLSYNLDVQNRITTTDEEFFTAQMFDNARTGARHTASASTNVKALKYITLSPNVNYNEVWYLKTIDKRFDSSLPENNQVVTDTISGFDAFREYSGGVSASTTIYGMFNFKKGRLQAIRHVLRPSVSFNYRPDFSNFYDEVQQSDDPDDTIEFTRFEGGIFGQPSMGVSSSIGIAINSTLEAKVMPRDSTETEAKKVNLLNNLNFSTNYNIAADSLKWSPVRVTAGTSILDNKLNLNANATLDPYALNASGTRINTFNINNGGSLFRLTNASLSASYSLSSDLFGKKKGDKKKGAQPSTADPNSESLFGNDITTQSISKNQDKTETKVAKLYRASVPWDMRLRYSLGYSNAARQNEISNNSLQFSGFVELSPKWKVNFSSGYDFKGKGITFTNLGFERDLDSWQMSFNWVPFGNSTTYYFNIRVKSSVLSDLKYDRRKVPDRTLF